MKIALIQPQFAPNLFDFTSMLQADQTIFQDSDPWSRKGRTHRASILNDGQSQWINLPIVSEDKKKPIHKVRIDHSKKLWLETFKNAIYHSYHNATFFDYFEDEFFAEVQIASENELLIDFNLHLFPKILNYLEVNLKYQFSSTSMGVDLTNHEIIQEYESKNYNQQLLGSKQPVIHDPKIRTIGECSVLHLLFTYGTESFRILEALK